MTAEQIATVAAADHILNAPPAWIEAEPPNCLLEILEVVSENLSRIREVGIGWRVVQLELMKGVVEKKVLPPQTELL